MSSDTEDISGGTNNPFTWVLLLLCAALIALLSYLLGHHDGVWEAYQKLDKRTARQALRPLSNSSSTTALPVLLPLGVEREPEREADGGTETTVLLGLGVVRSVCTLYLAETDMIVMNKGTTASEARAEENDDEDELRDERIVLGVQVQLGVLVTWFKDRRAEVCGATA
ncbi:hypothetical protein T439DRAFT_159830 [Meredithblackwellia eburnea MCA 4105]